MTLNYWFHSEATKSLVYSSTFVHSCELVGTLLNKTLKVMRVPWYNNNPPVFHVKSGQALSMKVKICDLLSLPFLSSIK